MHRYTAKIILRKDVPRVDSTCLLCLQCFINKARTVIPLHIYILPVQFQDNEERIVYTKLVPLEKKQVDDYNLIINQAKAKANDIFIHHRLTDDVLTVETFKKKYLDSESRHDFINFFKKEIEEQRSKRSKSTIKGYQNTLNKLEKFRSPLQFRELNYQFLADFERWMGTKDKTKEKLMINTIWKQHKNIKKFITIAIKKGVNIGNPYATYEVRKSEGERVYLTLPEVLRLQKVYDKGELTSSLQLTLRMFLFGCYTSMRISDMMRFNKDWIIDNTIIFVPEKTKHRNKVVRIPLINAAKTFVQNNYRNQFSGITEQTGNQLLKSIATTAKIRKHLSFHVARHTFALLFLKSGGKVEVLKEIMGHSKIETTMIYVHIMGSDKTQQMETMDKMLK